MGTHTFIELFKSFKTICQKNEVFSLGWEKKLYNAVLGSCEWLIGEASVIIGCWTCWLSPESINQTRVTAGISLVRAYFAWCQDEFIHPRDEGHGGKGCRCYLLDFINRDDCRV